VLHFSRKKEKREHHAPLARGEGLFILDLTCMHEGG